MATDRTPDDDVLLEVDRLVGAGWVDRRQSDADRREVSLALTGWGTEVLTRYVDLRLAELRERLTGLPATRRTAVIAALDDLNQGR
jgi:DNA-binding MarR family transcriptional regulator